VPITILASLSARIAEIEASPEPIDAYVLSTGQDIESKSCREGM
jgi:hypothetical protein